MPWDLTKCKAGGPMPFDASAALAAADFTKSVFVNTSAKKGKTRQAYTWVVQGGYKVCVVGHIHVTTEGSGVAQGNSFICGWKDWDEKTSEAAMTVIAKLPDGGSFPADRYPQKIG